MRKRIVIAVMCATGLLVGGPAGADTRPPGPGGGAYVDGGGNPTAEAHDGGSSPGGGGEEGAGGGSTPPCRWEVAIENDLQFPIYDVDTLDTMHSNTGRWLRYVCESQGPVAVDGQFVTPEGGLVDPAALAAEALASIEIPDPPIRTSPEPPHLFVQMATWLGIRGSWFLPYEATATAGNVTVTVRALPGSTTWDVGDGTVFRCAGVGTTWDEAEFGDAPSCTRREPTDDLQGRGRGDLSTRRLEGPSRRCTRPTARGAVPVAADAPVGADV